MDNNKIGRYEILRELGKGAMGVVYLARDPEIERIIALKTIQFNESGGGFDPDEAKARFKREARISGKLQHPNIVTLYDVGEHEGTLFLAMEFVSGGSLADKLTGPPTAVPVVDRIRIVAEVADALGYAHERGVIHRDIKPANILLTDTLAAKVTDFGIGKIIWGDVELTSAGQMVGSPAYMSPEQIRGEKLDSRSDIFSLGIVLYQTLTFKRPFPAETLTTLVLQILNEEPDDPTTIREDIPHEVGTVLKRMLAKNRDERYADAAEVAQDLRELVNLPGVLAGLSDSRIRRPKATVAPPSEGPTIQIVMKMPSRHHPVAPPSPGDLPAAVETASAPSPVAPPPPEGRPKEKKAPPPPEPPKRDLASPPPFLSKKEEANPPKPGKQKGNPPPPPLTPPAPPPAAEGAKPAPPEPAPGTAEASEAVKKDKLWRYSLIGLSLVILLSAILFAVSEVRRQAALKAVPTPTPVPPLPTFPISLPPSTESPQAPVSVGIAIPGTGAEAPVPTPVPTAALAN